MLSFIIAFIMVALLANKYFSQDLFAPVSKTFGRAFLKVLAALPMIMIVISLVFIAVPMSFDAQTLNEVLPILLYSIRAG